MLNANKLISQAFAVLEKDGEKFNTAEIVSFLYEASEQSFEPKKVKQYAHYLLHGYLLEKMEGGVDKEGFIVPKYRDQYIREARYLAAEFTNKIIHEVEVGRYSCDAMELLARLSVLIFAYRWSSAQIDPYQHMLLVLAPTGDDEITLEVGRWIKAVTLPKFPEPIQMAS